MLSKLALAATAVMAQWDDFDFDLGDIDLSDYDVDLSDIDYSSLYENGDSCVTGVTNDYCPTKCCAKNLKIDTTPWIGYKFWEDGREYS